MCKDVCKVVKAVFVKTQVFHLTKFCAALKCGKEGIIGSMVWSENFVGKEKKLVQVIPGQRKIIDGGLVHY